MLKIMYAAIAVTVTAWALPASAPAAPWPFYRGLEYDGKSPETEFVKTWDSDGPKIAWRADVGVGASSMVAVDGKVITMGNKDDFDVVTCLDPDTGKVLWTHRYPCKFEGRQFEGGTSATPTIEGDRVYTAAYDGQIFCLSLESGQVLWTSHLVRELGGKPSRWMYATSPLVIGDLVILDTGADGDSTVALNKMTGAKVWGSGSDGAGYSTPIPFKQGETDALMLFKAKHMVAYELATGRELWRVPWETQYDVNASSPIALDGSVLVSAGYRTGRASLLRLTDGTPETVWTNDEMKTRMSSVVVHNDHVYGITEDRARLLCLDLKTGEIAWEQRGFGQYGTLLIADDTIIALTDSGDLVLAAADPTEYRELARAKVLDKRCWVHPTLSDGRLYCRNNEGDLVCIDLRP